MAEIKMKNLIVEIGDKKYKMIGSRLEDICEELGISEDRFIELLSRDAYCPTLSAAPTSSTLTYVDTDGSTNHFHVGQLCRWAEGNDYRLAVCKNATETVVAWHILPTKVSELANDAGYLTSHQDISHLATKTEVSGKVDKVNGKQLSTEDFTTALKNKLNGLSNYDDTTISNALSSLQTQLNTLVSGNPSTAINSFNEIIAFLEGIADSEDLESIIASIEQQIADKQDKISDLETIRSGAAKGATALQSYTETDPVFSASAAAGIKPSDIANWNSKTSNTGTITGIKMNGASKGTSGVVDLGTVITAHQDISGKVDKVSGKGLSTNDYTTDEKNKLGGIAAGAEVNVQSDWNVTDTTSDAYIKNKPTIPSAVTESTVSGWGFTKNAGTYSKPSTGIPKTDLASAVQTSLGKADTALQSHQDISGKINGDGTITKIVKVTSLPSSPNANTLYVIV